MTANGIFQKHIDHFPSAAPPTAQDSIPAPGLEGKFQAEIDGLMSDIDSAINLNTHQPKQSTSTSATNERLAFVYLNALKICSHYFTGKNRAFEAIFRSF